MSIYAEIAQYIVANLDEDLTLDAISAHFGIPKFRLHRQFRKELGDTLGQYVLRHRLERAADALVLHQANVLQIALEVGFANHETFTRAFRRYFGIPPHSFRKSGRWRNHVVSNASGKTGVIHWHLSKSRLQKLASVPIVTTRHIGTYQETPVSLWIDLADTLEVKNVGYDLCVGIGYDPDGANSRFDAGLSVSEARVATGELPSGWYGVCTYVGPLSRMGEAYPQVYQQAAMLEDCSMIGLPVIEVYHESLVDGPHVDITRRTDIYVPVKYTPVAINSS